MLNTYNILLCSTGKKHIGELLEFLENNPISRENIEICTDMPELFPGYNVKKNPYAGYMSKVYSIVNCHFEEFIYLDSDIKINKLSSFDFYTSTYDLCAALEPLGHTERYFGITEGVDREYEGLPEYQTGVLWVRKTKDICAFLKYWYELHKKYDKQYENTPDQFSFKIAIQNTKVRIGVLPNNYNFRACYPQFIVGEALIVHSKKPKPFNLYGSFLKRKEARFFLAKRFSIRLESVFFKILRRI